MNTSRFRALSRGPRWSAPIALLLVLGPLTAIAGTRGETRQSPAPVKDGGAAGLTPAEREVVRLLRAMRAPNPPAPAELAPELARAEHGALGFLFSVLEQRVVPPLEDQTKQTLSLPQKGLALDGLRLLPSTEVARELDRWLVEPLDVGHRAAALEVLGAIGSSRDLERMLHLALGPRDASLDERVEGACRVSVAQVLGRDAGAAEILLHSWRGQRAELLPALLHATGDARDPRGLPFLADVAEHRSDLTLLVAAQTRLVGPSLSQRANQQLADALRPLLDPARPECCRTASLALGALGDAASIPLLIELLGHESLGVRDNALWALREMTELSFGPDPERWSRWYRDEMDWSRSRMPAVIGMLDADDVSVFTDALRLVERHPLFRHELAQAICTANPRRTSPRFALACRTLARLGSPCALSYLVESLDEEGESQRANALAVLRAITRLDLPDEARAWRNALPADVLD